MQMHYTHTLTYTYSHTHTHTHTNTHTHIHTQVLWLKSRNSEVWLDRRTNYTRSAAVMSMVVSA